MSITIRCGSCGKVGYAPESAAGKKAKCRGCGGVVSIPAIAAAVQKICTACGQDVSDQKRTKDTAGRYYCQPCWQAKVAAGAAADVSRSQTSPVAKPALAAATASRSAVSTAAPARVQQEPDDPFAFPPSLDDVEDMTDLQACPQCGISFPSGDMVPDDHDRMVCKACARQEVGLAPPPLPAVVPRVVVNTPKRQAPPLPYQAPRKFQQQSSGGDPHGRMMLIGGVVCAIGIVVTVGSYMNAVTAGGGGRYVVAWGAILFGGIRFFRGLAGKMSG